MWPRLQVRTEPTLLLVLGCKGYLFCALVWKAMAHSAPPAPPFTHQYACEVAARGALLNQLSEEKRKQKIFHDSAESALRRAESLQQHHAELRHMAQDAAKASKATDHEAAKDVTYAKAMSQKAAKAMRRAKRQEKKAAKEMAYAKQQEYRAADAMEVADAKMRKAARIAVEAAERKGYAEAAHQQFKIAKQSAKIACGAVLTQQKKVDAAATRITARGRHFSRSRSRGPARGRMK